MAQDILIGKDIAQNPNVLVNLNTAMGNRHGLIAGATGTGKTVTLQSIAESFSKCGVPVFMADIKGDLSGMAAPAGDNPKVKARIADLKLENYTPSACPVMFWDVFGEQGHPVRATISDMGPLMMSRLLGLNETQEGVLNLIFKIADERALHLYDLKDLQAMLTYVADNSKDFQTKYGNISAASVGAIQRGLLQLETQGADKFFGERMLNIMDFIQTDANGRGYINIFCADKLMQSPKLYSVFLLWMLSELFENLPEVGDLEKPKLVFFFDEAHLLFTEAPKVLLEKVEQMVRLIRSKGVGVYFVTQNPLDIPQTVLAQLGHRVQHALRAFTPVDKKAVDTVAQTMRENPKFKTDNVITELGVGEALVSVLQPNGTPSITERILVTPPASKIGPITLEERKRLISTSLLFGHYEKTIDNESAFEKLQELKKQKQKDIAEAEEASASKKAEAKAARPSGRQTVVEAMTKTAARTVASEVGRQIIRGVLGGIFGGRR